MCASQENSGSDRRQAWPARALWPAWPPRGVLVSLSEPPSGLSSHPGVPALRRALLQVHRRETWTARPPSSYTEMFELHFPIRG